LQSEQEPPASFRKSKTGQKTVTEDGKEKTFENGTENKEASFLIRNA
jgi:hypothetical protein